MPRGHTLALLDQNSTALQRVPANIQMSTCFLAVHQGESAGSLHQWIALLSPVAARLGPSRSGVAVTKPPYIGYFDNTRKGERTVSNGLIHATIYRHHLSQ